MARSRTGDQDEDGVVLHRRRPPQADEPGADGVAGQLDPVSQVQLVEQVVAMAVDRVWADHEHLGDLAGRVALGDERQDL